MLKKLENLWRNRISVEELSFLRNPMVELHITCGTQNGNRTYRECEFKQQEPDLTTKQWSLSLSIEYGSKFGKQAGRDFGTILTRSVAFSWRA